MMQIIVGIFFAAIVLVNFDFTSDSKYATLQQKNKTASTQIEELTAQVQTLEARENQIELQIERQETDASLYLGCSWPINLCPGAVSEAGKAAIEAGRGGGRSWQVWMFRSIWITSFWLIACFGIFLFYHLFTIYTGPKKAEIEKHKKLMENLEEASETLMAKAENRADAVFQAAKEKERKKDGDKPRTGHSKVSPGKKTNHHGAS